MATACGSLVSDKFDCPKLVEFGWANQLELSQKTVGYHAWTMDKMGTEHVKLNGVNDKHQITAIIVAVQLEIFTFSNLFIMARQNDVSSPFFRLLQAGLCPYSLCNYTYT